MSTPYESDARSAQVTFGDAWAQAVAAERFMRIRNSSSPTTIATRPTPTPDSDAGSQADAPADSPWLEQRHSVAEERVLAEIAHELGNFFHKLYYWADFLQEKRADDGSDGDGRADARPQTIGKLEEFLKGSLDYFQPLKLSPVQMPVADVVAGMIVQLRAQLHGWPVRVSDAGGWDQRSVLIDPARFPAVFRCASAGRLTERAPAGTGVHVGLEARSDGIEAAFHVEGRFGDAALPDGRVGRRVGGRRAHRRPARRSPAAAGASPTARRRSSCSCRFSVESSEGTAWKPEFSSSTTTRSSAGSSRSSTPRSSYAVARRHRTRPRRSASSASTSSRWRSSTSRFPGTDGIGLTREIRERWPDLDVIMITGYASIKGAVEAIKQGASDYITKPFQKEEILLATEKVLEKRRLLDEINYLRSQLSDRYSFANMVSRNRVMHEIFETIERARAERRDRADQRRVGHRQGARGARHPLPGQAQERAASSPSTAPRFPDTLLESELFGYERGAFTGAVHDRVGKIELSSGGTLFLDEIESISLNMQLKLLRVLEEREVEKLGGNRRIKVNMRVICATNMDLGAAGRRGPDARGLLLPHQRRADAHPAAARAHRGHPAAGGRVPAQQRDGAREGHQPRSRTRRCRSS